MSDEYSDPREDASSPADRPGGSGPGHPFRAKIILLAKVALALTLCVIIVAMVDWRAASSGLARTGIELVAVMFAILTANVFLSAYKWRLLLAIHGVEYSTLRLTRYYFIAVFLNNFLPTSIGGDGYRIYKTMRNERSRASAIIAVLMERLTGFGALVALGVASAALLASEAAGPMLVLLIGIVAACCVVAVPLSARMHPWVPRRLLNALPARLRQLLGTLAEHVDDYVRHPGRSLAVLLISVLFHLTVAYAFFLLLHYGADQPITMLQVVAVLAVTTLAAVLPISFNGLGVYEGTFIYLFAQYGVPPDVSIVPMILNRAALIALSLFGAAAYLLDHTDVPAKAVSVDIAR